MLTDTEGIDFNDYLRRVYFTVKRNWEAVMPASVQLGDQGVVSLQFKIMKDGSVPDGDPAQIFSSGKEPLDRAAFSSIRASNPFPQLPAGFKAQYIELRFTYYYNLQPPR
jgi:TonB family protein